jgi:hypothetical protein
MDIKYPKTIVLPPVGPKRKALEEWMFRLKANLPQRVRYLSGIAVYIEYLLFRQLFEEGLMINTDTFLETLQESQPDLVAFLKSESYIFPVVCNDVNRRCRQ